MVIKQTTTEGSISLDQAGAVIKEYFCTKDFSGKRLLCLIPDNTRSGPIGEVFKLVYQQIGEQCKALDCLVALGTHRPLSEQEICERLTISSQERSGEYASLGLFNHEWKNRDTFTSLGKISADEMTRLSGGLLGEEIDVCVNKLLLEYDELLILGPVFPHEVVGFSGGYKYIFPGVAGREIIDCFHWLGALVSLPEIIGKADTPTREVVEAAAALLDVPSSLVATVSRGKEFKGVFAGEVYETWQQAAGLSEQVNIERMAKPFKTVVGLAAEMYEDLWTAGKAAYKLDQIVADGGQLIIYAPHVREFSLSHGEAMERVGYHVRDYFTGQAERFAGESRCAMAHSTHVRGTGSYQAGIEKTRIKVVLASGVSRQRCEEAGLGYLDPASLDIGEFREQEDTLVVEKAGEVLYKLDS